MAHLKIFALIWAVGVVTSGAEVLYMPLNGLELAHQRASGIGCLNHLIQILHGARSWSTDNADQPPPDLQTLTNDLPSPVVLFCPANFANPVPTNWAQLDWGQIDYEWLSVTNWDEPTNIVVRCRIHESGGQAQGSAIRGGFRPGWPWITAGPSWAGATPNEDIELRVKIATNAVQPVSYQWRRGELSDVTNVVRITNPDDPNGVYWQTNVVSTLTSTNLIGQTNATLVLARVQTNDSGYYSIAVANALGVSVSHAGRLLVDSSFAGITTNELWSQAYCLNNLKMMGLVRNMWALDHNDQPARSFAVLTNSDGSHMLGWPTALFCRSDTNRAAPAEWPDVDFAKTSYEPVSTEFENPYAPFCRCRVHGFYLEMDGEAIKQPRLDTINRLPNNGFELNFRVFAGRTNLLEASADLVNWTELANYPPTYGEFRYVDNEPHLQRFYRLRMP